MERSIKDMAFFLKNPRRQRLTISNSYEQRTARPKECYCSAKKILWLRYMIQQLPECDCIEASWREQLYKKRGIDHIEASNARFLRGSSAGFNAHAGPAGLL